LALTGAAALGGDPAPYLASTSASSAALGFVPSFASTDDGSRTVRGSLGSSDFMRGIAKLYTETRMTDRRSPEAEAYRRLYKLARWNGKHGVRAQQLKKQPLCEMCRKAGRLTKATVCDHVDPKSKLTVEGFFAGPFQSLCAPCHDITKRTLEIRGYSDALGEDGWPTDPRHPANQVRTEPPAPPRTPGGGGPIIPGGPA